MLANRRPSRGWVIHFREHHPEDFKTVVAGYSSPLTWVIEGSRKGITLPRNVRTLEKEKSWDLSLRREAGKRSSFFFFLSPASLLRSREWDNGKKMREENKWSPACLTSYLGQARIRDVTCCVSPLPRELYAEEEFDCLQIEEHLSRHVTPCRRKGKCFVFFLSTLC